VHEFVENLRDDRAVVHLEEEASLAGKTEHFFKEETRGFFENRVDEGVDQAGVAFALVLAHQDLVLNVEVAHVVLKVDVT